MVLLVLVRLRLHKKIYSSLRLGLNSLFRSFAGTRPQYYYSLLLAVLPRLSPFDFLLYDVATLQCT